MSARGEQKQGVAGEFCQCLFYSAAALARTLNRFAEEEFAPLGLAPTYGFLLMTVNAHAGVQPTRIAAIMQLTPSTITRLIEKMEAEGYLRRETSGRVTAVYATARAKRLDPKLRAAWRRLYDRYARTLTPEFSQTLTRDIFAASETLQSPAASVAPVKSRTGARVKPAPRASGPPGKKRGVRDPRRQAGSG